MNADLDLLLSDAAERARRYLVGLDGRPVFPDNTAVSGLASLDERLPDSPVTRPRPWLRSTGPDRRPR